MEIMATDFNLSELFFPPLFLTQDAFLRENCAQGISSARMVSKLFMCNNTLTSVFILDSLKTFSISLGHNGF